MLNNLLNLFYPAKCLVCGNVFKIDNQNVICKNCIKSIKPVKVFYCKSCGSPVENCQKCVKQRKFDYLKVFTSANSDLINLLATYKFQGIKPLGKEIASIIYEDIINFVKKENIDLITFIPITKRLYKERGFNHLEIILRNIFPSYLIKEVLVKIKETKFQAHLPADERRKNIKYAFSLKKNINIKGKRILIFDDILTTGSTMLEAYKTVKKGNPDKIFGYVICR